MYLNPALALPASSDTLPAAQLTKLCHMIVRGDSYAARAKSSAHMASATRAPARRRGIEAMAWVYTSLYDSKPVGLVFSPTAGLTFYLPLGERGEILFAQASYLDKSFSEIALYLRSGQSVLETVIGEKTPVPNGSLAGWIERTFNTVKKK